MPDPVTRLNAALEGRYAIERELGEGGMATVYLADDLKHERKVALKVLKPELAAVVGAERFLAEIKTTANLTHPHILPLFDSGEADGFLFYVMPYLEGETLRDRIDREKQLPVDEAARIATAVANALDHAHRHKVIHRDIKPGNILLQDGQPVVSDFGIALAVGVAGGGRLTETGLSLGTPHYMSPEQATGDLGVGAATDIYALGCVLYEMLVAEPPYTGGTPQAILGKIIAGELASATSQRASVPANVDSTLRKALEKVPADRFASAQDFVRALGDEHFRYGELTAASADAALGPWNRLTMAMTTLAAVTTLGFVWSLLGPEPPALTQSFSLATNEGQVPTPSLSVAPDGSAMVMRYAADASGPQLWLRRFTGELAWTPVPETQGAFDPVFSVDGEEVAFLVGTQLRVSRLGGGLTRTLADSVSCCLTWGSDGFIYYQDATRGISRVPVDGGLSQPVLRREESDGDLSHYQLLPGGQVAVFTVWATPTRIDAIRLETGERKTVVPAGRKAQVTPTGHLVFTTAERQLLAAVFDRETMETVGPILPLVDGLYSGTGVQAVAAYGLSDSGTLVYWMAPSAGVESELVWVTRSAQVTPVDPSWTGSFNHPRLSPDGSRVAVSIGGIGTQADVWIKQLDRGPNLRLTFEGSLNEYPAWTPDGGSVTFSSNRAGDRDLWTKRADGSAQAVLEVDRQRGVQEAVWSLDGEWMIYRTRASEPGRGDIMGLAPGQDTLPVPLVATEFQEVQPTLSPSGRWLAYQSDETGRYEIYVVPFPNTGDAKWAVSISGGTGPLWAHSGQELFYQNGQDEIVAVQVETEPTFSAGQSTVLFPATGFRYYRLHRHYDVAPDDQRFVMIRALGDSGPNQLVLVTNWFEELRERMGN